MTKDHDMPIQGNVSENEPGITMGEVLSALRDNLKLLTITPITTGLLALGITFIIAPSFTARTIFLPPQQAQSGAASALASLGSLTGLSGGSAGISNIGDRYVALLQSVTLADRIVDEYKLMQIYDSQFRVDARKELATNVRISLGKKDGLITLEVDDKDAQRAADIANRYVTELRRLTGTLAVTEAQQRRVFFERQLQLSQSNLVLAQKALQSSGFNAGALKAEPKAAAEAYAKIKAEATATEVRLQTMRGALTDSTPEVRQLQITLTALREQLARAERASDSSGGTDYISKYREFKYQETLFELYARQFELARADESREGTLIQVVDAATPPERKSKPKRATTAAATTMATAVLLAAWVLMRTALRMREIELPPNRRK
jgi:capsule polysaccharide export protein KpsE/RkpR